MEASKRPACSRCARPSDADRLPLRCLGRASFLDEGDGERGGAYVRDLVPAQPQDLVAPRCRQLSRHPERSKATANRPGARPGCPARCTAQAPAVSGSVRLWSASREPAIPARCRRLPRGPRRVGGSRSASRSTPADRACSGSACSRRVAAFGWKSGYPARARPASLVPVPSSCGAAQLRLAERTRRATGPKAIGH